ncbi:MAG: ACP S-malonyltransferase, partial [Bdellovibrionales bacterium]|nr:ACP S-malonyltransferase [Bdellovibrionales bacterium]
PSVPVYANVSARAITSGDQARDLLKQQVCSSVRWTESMENMVSSENVDVMVEFGPGGVLSKLQKRINSMPTVFVVDEAEAIEKVRAELA